MNYQAWLAAQDLTFQDGLVPENNISDSAAQAWNDSITISSDTSSDHSAFAMLIVADQAQDPIGPMATEEMLTISVELHSQGLRFGLSAQGDMVMSLLLENPIPRQQLNNALFSALRPLLATVGPWNNGYGMRRDNLQVEVHVQLGNAGL